MVSSGYTWDKNLDCDNAWWNLGDASNILGDRANARMIGFGGYVLAATFVRRLLHRFEDTARWQLESPAFRSQMSWQ